MSLIIILSAALFSFFTVLVVMVFLRQRRQLEAQVEAMLATFEKEQLTTYKRLADILLSHQKKQDELADGLERVATLALQTRKAMAVRDADIIDDDEPVGQSRAGKWLN